MPASISVEAIRALREQTGAGIMDCKRALQEAGGDPARAVELLRERGLAIAAKKAHREAREGVVEAYVHPGNRLGAMIELNCETDFVARTPEFRALAHDLAMQVAAMQPVALTPEEDPSPNPPKERELYLLFQPFIKDPTKTVRDLLNEAIAKVGENIRIKRFSRFALGE